MSYQLEAVFFALHVRALSLAEGEEDEDEEELDEDELDEEDDGVDDVSFFVQVF